MVNKFAVLDSISKPGGESNEDLIGITDSCVWLLDGATGLTNSNVLPGNSDAGWFVQAISRNMVKNLQEEIPTKLVLENVINSVIKEFETEATQENIEDIHKPSASFTIARIIEDSVEIGNLGDCRLIYKKCKGQVNAFGTSRVTELDRSVVQKIVDLRNQKDINNDELWLELKDILYRNRALKNTDEGYWILDLTLRSIPHFQQASISVKGTEAILLVSDGLYRLVDTYHLYDDESLLKAAMKFGLHELYDRLRNVEKLDHACRMYPRLIPQVDASGLLVSLG